MTRGTEAPVVIVGAGLAGLACATTLIRRGVDAIIIEASDAVGGRVRTDRVDGFLLDRGFQVLLTAYPELDLYASREELALREFAPGAVVVRPNRSDVISDPFRAPKDLPASVRTAMPGGIASLADLWYLWHLRRRLTTTAPADLLRGTDVPTADALPLMGFSDRFISAFLRPFVGGVQLDPKLATSVRMFDVIMRMLLVGSAGVPAEGMGALPKLIASRLPADTVRFETKALALAKGSVQTESGDIAARRVVVATEGPEASRLLEIEDPGSRTAGCIWFDIPKPPVRGRRIVLAGDDTTPVLNAAVMSDVAPSYAPEGRHLIALATPGDIGPDVEQRAMTQARRWWGDMVDDWRHLRTDRIRHGQPDQSSPLRPRQTVRVRDEVFVCGDHRDTGSIQGALFSGRRCAEAVLADLGV
ncbi:MAG: NAD(P)/FAD-dependent oxidoreductase [Ilumatobacteraceae bacterium]|jgi:phytoene dehydrogenase-like protein